MQTIAYNELKSNFDKVWQYSKSEPVLIHEQGENVRVLLSFDEFLKLTNQSPTTFGIKKSDYAGGLAEFANPALIPLE